MLNIGKQNGYTGMQPIKKIKHFFRCIKGSYQRITKGYADCDLGNLDIYLTELFSVTLSDLADITHTYPCSTDESFTIESGQQYLRDTAELFKHSLEDNDFYKNSYEEAAFKCFEKGTTEPTNDGYYRLVTNYTEEEQNIVDKYNAEELEIIKKRSNDLMSAFSKLEKHFLELGD